MIDLKQIDKNFLASKGVWGSLGSIVLGAILALDPSTQEIGLGVLSSGAMALWGRITAKGSLKLW